MIAVLRIRNNTPAEVTDVPVCRRYFRNGDLILQVIVMWYMCTQCYIRLHCQKSRGEWCVRIRYISLESILSGKSGGLHLFDECMLLLFLTHL